MAPRTVGIVAAALAAAGLFALVGGADDDFASRGGLRMTWRPPAGYDAHRLSSRLAAHGTGITVGESGDATIEVAGVSPSYVPAVAERMATQPFELHEVLETVAMKEVGRVVPLPMRRSWPVDADVDTWRDHGLQHTDVYLRGERAAVQAKLGEAFLGGWKLPAHAHIAYGLPAERLHADEVRTYVVADTVEVDGDDIARAAPEYDPRTERELVAMTLTPQAAERYGEFTARVAGHKVAFLVGGEVAATQVIERAVRTGYLAYYPDGAVPRQAREQEVAVAALGGGALPAGGTVREASYIPPRDPVLPRWLIRALVALGGGALVGLGVHVGARRVRQRRRALL